MTRIVEREINEEAMAPATPVTRNFQGLQA